MKALSIERMEMVRGGGCNGIGYAGFGVVAVVGICVIASVATGGAALPFLLTAAGKFSVATLTAAGVGAMYDGCK